MLGLSAGHSVVIEAPPVARAAGRGAGRATPAGSARTSPGSPSAAATSAAVLGSTDADEPGARAPAAQRADAHGRRDRRRRRRPGRDRARRHPGRALRGVGARPQAGRRDPAPPPPGGQHAVGRRRVPVRGARRRRRHGTTTTYADLSYAAAFCDRDGAEERWDRQGAAQARLVEHLAPGRELRIVAPGTDLTLRVGRPDVDQLRRPSRTSPTARCSPAPHEDSAEGVVTFPFPAHHAGRRIDGVRLGSSAAWWSRRTPTTGRTCSTRRSPPTPARAGWARSASAPTTRCRGSPAARCSTRRSAAPCHLALGSSYPETGGTQRLGAALGPGLRPARRRRAAARRPRHPAGRRVRPGARLSTCDAAARHPRVRIRARGRW